MNKSWIYIYFLTYRDNLVLKLISLIPFTSPGGDVLLWPADSSPWEGGTAKQELEAGAVRKTWGSPSARKGDAVTSGQHPG